MPRQKSGEFDQSKYMLQYAKDHVIQRVLNFNPSANQEDAKLLEWLDKQPNKARYLKGLIKADMESKLTSSN